MKTYNNNQHSEIKLVSAILRYLFWKTHARMQRSFPPQTPLALKFHCTQLDLQSIISPVIFKMILIRLCDATPENEAKIHLFFTA